MLADTPRWTGPRSRSKQPPVLHSCATDQCGQSLMSDTRRLLCVACFALDVACWVARACVMCPQTSPRVVLQAAEPHPRPSSSPPTPAAPSDLYSLRPPKAPCDARGGGSHVRMACEGCSPATGRIARRYRGRPEGPMLHGEDGSLRGARGWHDGASHRPARLRLMFERISSRSSPAPPPPWE